MGSIALDCPHAGCRTQNVAFTTIASRKYPDLPSGTMFAICTHCSRGVVVEVLQLDGSGWQPENMAGLEFEDRYSVMSIAPSPPEPSTVAHLPRGVQIAFEEAEQAYVRDHRTAAALSYRAAMERALKSLQPDGKGKLFQRIDALAPTIPDALIAALHEIRFLGNDAAHEIEDVGAAELTAAREFLRLFFIYTFALPAEVKLAVEAREMKKQAD